MDGVYVLLIWLKEKRRIRIGKLGPLEFARGLYFYVGRALNGLEARIERHLRKGKRHFWHIDYLLEYSEILGIIYVWTSHGKSECKIASNLGKRFELIENFGSSDCRCRSHLFFKPMQIKKPLWKGATPERSEGKARARVGERPELRLPLLSTG